MKDVYPFFYKGIAHYVVVYLFYLEFWVTTFSGGKNGLGEGDVQIGKCVSVCSLGVVIG